MPDDPSELVPRSEVARAVAAALAVERRKRRRVQIALAGAVGIIALTGGAFAWWQDKQLSAQLAETARVETEQRVRADHTREQVLALLKSAGGHLRDSQSEQAADALRLARESAVREARELLPEIERAERELDLLRKLDEADRLR